MAIQQIRDSTFTVGGSLTIIAQSNCQGAFCFSSRSAGSAGAILSSSEGVSNLILDAERLQRSAKELSFELKLTTGSPIEYHDLAMTLDEMAEETMPYVFGFLLQGFRLDELCCRRVSGEITYMQGILDAFARKRAVDRNGAMQTMKQHTTGEAIIDILWSYFWWLFYAQWLIRKIRQSLSVSRDRIYVVLFKRMVSMCKSVRCHQIDIDDFFGVKWSIPQDLCLDRQVFLSILRFKFQDGPAEVVVKSEQFGIFCQDGSRAIQIPDWENAIQEGGGLQLSVFVKRQSQARVDDLDLVECPQCGKSDKTIYGDSFDGWVSCLRCSSDFNLASIDLETPSNPAFSSTSGAGPDQSKHSSAFCRFSVTVTKTEPLLSNYVQAESLTAEELLQRQTGHVQSQSFASTTSWTSSTSTPVDESVQVGADYVLAMHDFTPDQEHATCLAFKAGQVIRVHGKDASGWWDGEVDDRRGWFPSNYVQAEIKSLNAEDLPRNRSRSTTPEAYGNERDSHCPALMVPLLHGLSLLQNAVRSNRAAHFAPSAACIVSCVRAILSATETLQRDAPILQRYPSLGYERRKILAVLAALVAQAKKAADPRLGDDQREGKAESMLQLGGQVFAHVRRFLTVAVQCGVELPNQHDSTSPLGSTATGFSTGSSSQIGETPVSISSASSSSSSISSEGGYPSDPPAFPSGICTGAQVMEALRSTHDQYLSTIAAFIGHLHSHSRTAHASSMGHLYDLVREIVEASSTGKFRAAKEGLYNGTASLVESVRLLTVPLPATWTEEEEKQSLLRTATNALKAGADCVGFVNLCLKRSTRDHPFYLELPNITENGEEPFPPNK